MGRRQVIGIVIAWLLLLSCCSPALQTWFYPHELRIIAGTPYLLQLPFPFGISIHTDKPDLLVEDAALRTQGCCSLMSEEVGFAGLELRLFGFLPLRRWRVQVLPSVEVVPSGHSIGVAIRATTMVVGHASVKSMQGQKQPSKDAGLQLGDLIISANGQDYPAVEQVAQAIEQAGRNAQPLELLVRRQGKEHKISVTPIYCVESKQWRIGLYIRDDAAGVGTLTYVDRQNQTFGALGHIIADLETSQALEVREGKIMRSHVTAIDQGRSGHPGEKRSIIVEEQQVLGRFNKNTNIGIFGDVLEDITVNQALPVALVDDVMPGQAEILTVIQGEQVERFQVEIVRVAKQYAPSSKGLVIKVTDPDLLQRTGGIVQGMSGSPILQNGRLVGAVTHVFINKPDTGYGVFAEWMVRESGSMEPQEAVAPTFLYRQFYPLEYRVPAA